jgi:hypothetical protein
VDPDREIVGPTGGVTVRIAEHLVEQVAYKVHQIAPPVMMISGSAATPATTSTARNR